MKRNFIILIVSICSCIISNSTKAQKNEINVSYGTVTSSEISELFSETILTGFTGGLYSFKNFKSTGAINVDYYRSASKRFKFGGAFIYEQFSREISFNKEFSGKTKNNYITVMPQIKFLYIAKPAFELYSGLGLGASLRNETFDPKETNTKKQKDSEIFMAFHANLLGIRVGKKLGGFAEIGFGNKGLINAGISYRF